MTDQPPAIVSPAPKPAARPVDVWLARVLTAIIIFTGLLALFGGLRFLTAHGRDPATYGTYTPQPEHLSGAADAVRHALRGDPKAIMQAALVLLILTPLIRVAFALVSFTLERDRLYVLVSAVVLAILAFGFFGAGHG